jgi:metallo-beta-lactamase family protein
MPNRAFQLNAPSPGPRVVVTSSGSCDGGPVAAWLPKVLESSRNIVALVGYAADTSVGGRLAAIMKMPLHERARDAGNLTWANNATYPIAKVHAAIIQLSGYSAHADQKGLLDWLFWHYQDRAEVAGRAVFIQHGGNSQRERLSLAICERAHVHGATVEIFQPTDSHQWWNLERGARAMSIDTEMSEIAAKIARLTAVMQRLQNYAAESA